MKAINIHFETTVNYDLEIEISDKNYERWENGEIDDDELLEMYQDKIESIQADFDLNEGDLDTNYWME